MANSLGTLTLDLIARIGGFTGPMDKASASVKKNAAAIKKENDDLVKSFGNFGKGVGAAVAAVPAILAGLVTHTASTAKEITKLSGLAGLGTTEFQQYAAGAATVGIEQDKLSDILKDTNDKVGDFLSTGAGGMKDFFTNIAPLVGVTAENFKKLNSADALKLYVSTLEKANVSQNEMTFYMEAIANDSTALVPLLRDNGKAWDELGAAALSAGNILDTQTIASAAQFSAELVKVENYIGSAKVALAAEFMPVLAQFTKDLNESSTKAGGLGAKVHDLADDIVEAAAFVANIGDGIVRVFDIVANTLVGMFSSASGRLQNLASQANTALSWITIGDTAAEFKADAADMAASAAIQFNVAAQAAAKINENLETPLIGDRFKTYVADAKAAATQLKVISNTTGGTGSGVDPAVTKANEEASKKAASAAESAAKKISEAFKSTETDYLRQIELINTTSDAAQDASEVEKLAFEYTSGKLTGINAQQRERLTTLAAELDALEKLKLANEDNVKAASFSANLDAENKTVKQGFDIEFTGAGSGDKLRERLQADLEIQQEYNDKAADLQKQLNGGDISEELYKRETELLSDALDERMALQQDYYAKQDELQNDWLSGVSSAWENYRDVATDYNQQAADATSTILGDATSGLSESIQGLALQTMTVGEAFTNLGTTIGNSVVKALADMAAQWLITQAVQLTGITTLTTATVASEATKTAAKVASDTVSTASTLTSIATTTTASVAAAVETLASWAPAALTASIGSFGTAAVVGGAALIAAFALISGFETGGYTGDGASDAVAGIVHKGEYVFTKAQTQAIGVDRLEALAAGYEGGGLVTESVTTVSAGAKMTQAVDTAQQQRSSGGMQVNIIEDASRAGQTRTRLDETGMQEVMDVFISRLYNEDDVFQALQRKTGARAVGT